MKHGLYSIGTAVFLLLLNVLWDALFHTQLTKLLLNVDFMIDYRERKPSFAEEAAYHMITGVIIYMLLLVIARKYERFYKPALIIILIFTCALYFILAALAVRPLSPLSVIGAAGWFLSHVCYFLVVARLQSSTISQ
ncbi:hypothetical protein [Macrococcus equipercicus]|uniref:Uncharacterized protein n=1 Tax=Macrococcus equipercicus TaxID=69967 RepID=A0A9Q9BM83_9STAP|nr:hypothetical protein [Macrococcus equipercicus]UTH14133.1 hypothetical protein KFV11_01805 [Macrococcus equipercicus]